MNRRLRRRVSSFGWWSAAAAVSLCAAAVLGLVLLSFRSPRTADDYAVLISLRDHPFPHDFIAHRYTGAMGRLTPMMVMYVALRFPRFWAVANGAAFVTLVVTTFAVARGRWPRIVRRDLQVLAVVFAAYWFTLPAIGQTVFWRSASGYLWTTSLLLLFIFPYRRWLSATTDGVAARRADRTDRVAVRRAGRVVASAGGFLFGFVVGCSREQFIVALCVLFAVFAVKVRQRGLRDVPPALLTGALGAACGAVTLLLAPGNGVRLAEEGALSLTVFERAHAFAGYLAAILVHWLPPLIPWLLCLLVAAVPMRQAGGDRLESAARPRAWWIWGLAGVATLAPFVITPGNGAERTAMFLAVFLLVSVLSLAADGRRRALDRLPSAATSAVIAGLMLCVLVSMAASVRHATVITDAIHQRERSVSAQKARGVEDVVVPPIEGTSDRAVYYRDLSSDPQSGINEAVADWYGVRTIIVDGEAGSP